MLFLADILNLELFWIVLWVGILIFALVIELATEQLVSIWFSGASLISFILALCNVKWWIQIIVFIICSGLLVAFSRTFINKVLQKDIPTNSDSLIGQEILVISPITKNQLGEGKVRDITWSLISEDEIDINEYVIITSIEGNKLRVKRKEIINND
jgi:membrane protein implicated in regulation of membrane protease activity